jgi:hypothetical protein
MYKMFGQLFLGQQVLRIWKQRPQDFRLRLRHHSGCRQDDHSVCHDRAGLLRGRGPPLHRHRHFKDRRKNCLQ